MKPSKMEVERQKKQSASITKHYKTIGPAAVAAALIHARKAPSGKIKAA